LFYREKVALALFDLDSLYEELIESRAYNGYVPLNRLRDFRGPRRTPFSEKEEEALRQLVSLIREDGRQVVVFTTPARERSPRLDSDLRRIAARCEEMEVTFLDLTYPPEFSSRTDYFCDFTHLTEKGSIVYSELLRSALEAQLSSDVIQ
jgi:hypothetical protein